MSAVPQAIIVGQRLHLAVWGQMDNAKRRYPACGGSPSDGKIQRQNAEKNFTVRFTVKKICLEAIEADRWRKAMDYSHSIISWRHNSLMQLDFTRTPLTVPSQIPSKRFQFDCD
jgi:hypothetical protein